MAFIVILADVGMIIGKPPSPLRLVAANTAVVASCTTLIEGVEKRGARRLRWQRFNDPDDCSYCGGRPIKVPYISLYIYLTQLTDISKGMRELG